MQLTANRVMAPSPATLSGLLPILKPAGMTSKDVSRAIERRVGKLKMGHVGTLDPVAQGVLPLLIGGATKLQDLLLELPKTYEFEVSFGIETDTLDLEGKVIANVPCPALSAELIEAHLDQFRGAIVQEPPLYSAIKYQGKPLYEYARSERSELLPELSALSREVHVYELTLLGVEQDRCTLRMTSSKGTYVRSLARDLARSLGTVGTVSKLLRTKSSGISLENCVQLDSIQSFEDIVGSIIGIDRLSRELTSWQSILPGWTKRLMNGQSLEIRADLFAQGCLSDSFSDRNFFDRILLLSHDGQAFGLGTIVRNPVQTVSVSMRRGLL
jgi:tRNA pseudouridine55 synthase